MTYPVVNLCSDCASRHVFDAVKDPGEPFAPVLPCGRYPDARLEAARRECGGREWSPKQKASPND